MKAPRHLTFQSLAIGDRFRWRSNLGAGDLMEKVSATELRNTVTGNVYEPTRAKHYFGPTDPVELVERPPVVILDEIDDLHDENRTRRKLNAETIRHRGATATLEAPKTAADRLAALDAIDAQLSGIVTTLRAIGADNAAAYTVKARKAVATARAQAVELAERKAGK